MRKKTFILLVLATLACFVAANIAIARWSHRLSPMKKLSLIDLSPPANVLFIGNSLLDGRIDPAVFTRDSPSGRDSHSGLVALNVALGASQPPEQYLLFHRALKDPAIQQVVIGFYDFQLTHNERDKVNDLQASRSLAFDPRIAFSDAVFIYGFDLLDRVQFRIYRALPLLAYRDAGWEKVELLRRWMGRIGMPAEVYNRFGRAADFAALESASVSGFDQEAATYASHPTGFNLANQAILNESAKRHIRVTFVLMPASPYHRERFYSRASWASYVQALRAQAASQGVDFIDASNWFLDEDDFIDHLHMKFDLNVPFTERIAHALAAQDAAPRLTSSH